MKQLVESSAWSVTPNPLSESGSDERWYSTDTLSGTATATTTIFTFTHQYLVSFAVSPSSGGTTDPSGANVWEDAGTLSISASANSGYVFDHWSSSTGSITFDDYSLASTTATIGGAGTITANFVVQTTVEITVTSSPAGSGFVKVDGSAITTPQTFDWTPGDIHSLAALSPVAGATGTQYVWTSWSDGYDQTHDIVTPSTATTYTANYKTQYYLTVNTDPADLTTPSGEGWYDAGDDADISTDNPVGTYYFAGWTTDDQDEIAEQYALETTVLMDKAKTVTANYVRIIPGTGGKTLGFWSNKNGQSYIGDDDLSFLRGLNLFNKDGSDFNPENYAAFKTWLLKADAVKMGYMLSAQLAATELSVYNGLLSGSQTVWVDDGDGIYEPGEGLTIDSIMADANGLTMSGDRATQEYYKNLLDKINNNLLWFVV